jgi:hypothetical protein
MKGKVLASFRLAFPRFLSGILGTWCCVGPILLLNGSDSASWELWAGLLLLLLCYVVVIVIWLRAKWDALTKLISETTLALCFMIAGLLLNEMMGVFMAAKDEMAIAYAFFGFFIAELMKPKPPMEGLRELFTSVHRNCLRLVGRV